MNRPWTAPALGLLADGQPTAMVTIAAAAGSTPREAGARMIIGSSEAFGTIGGGNLELVAVDQARKLLARANPGVMQQDYPLGPLLAQCCGGRVRLLVERLDPPARGWLGAADAAERAGRRYTLEGDVSARSIRRACLSGWLEGEAAGVALLDATGRPAGQKAPWSRIVERIAPVATTLCLFGAGHVGRALAPIVAALPFRLLWADTRPEMAAAGPEIVADPLNLVSQAAPDSFFLVMTHAHELDYALVRAILARGDAAFCGVIGSATKRARFVSRLTKEGVDASTMVCPIGVATIESKDPACIAVAVAADLLMRLERLGRATG